MSETTVEWIALVLFLLLFVAATAAEIWWLVKKRWATSGRAIAYVLVSDLVGFGIGGLICFVIFFVMFMLVMGPAGRGGNTPEPVYWLLVAVAIILPIGVLIITKALTLMIFKIRSGKAAWVHSLIISILLSLVTLIPAPAFYFLLAYLLKWRS